MEYQIITAESDAGLERKVNKLISKGWIPLGGVASDNIYLYQAMGRDKKKH